MAKQPRHASRKRTGGYGARRSSASRTPTRSVRNAPELTASAAIVMSKAIDDTARTTRKAQATNLLRSTDARAAFAAHLTRRTDASAMDRSLIYTNIEARADAVKAKPSHLHRQAKQLIQQIGKLAGPRGITHVEPAPSRRHSTPPPRIDWSLTSAPRLSAEQRPPPPPRTRRIINELALHRLADVPPLAVICPERAAARVQKWRKHTGELSAPPPLWLLRELLHTETIPTALASPSDHFYLPVPGRWVTIAELLALFHVHPSSALYAAVFAQRHLTERQLAEAIGRAMFPPSVETAIRRAMHALPAPLPTKPAYASSCSGLDLASVAMDAIFGAEWTYTAASESDRKLADFLAHAYRDRGLAPSRVACDCAAVSATSGAAGADIFVLGPPCGPWSQRNHAPSAEERKAEVDRLDTCLDYARHHRPAIVVIENVDTRDVTSAIVALLASLPGYRTRSFVADARDQGPMCRKRRYYYAVRAHE